MASLNKACIIGNLGRDPEIRKTQGGKPIANLSVATSESWTDRQTGEKRESTEWHRVVIFHEGLAGVAEKYLRKGSKVYIEGKLQTRKWTDKDGVERYTTEIVLQAFGSTLVMLGGKEGGGERSREPGDDYEKETKGYSSGAKGYELDDEIPF